MMIGLRDMRGVPLPRLLALLNRRSLGLCGVAVSEMTVELLLSPCKSRSSQNRKSKIREIERKLDGKCCLLRVVCFSNTSILEPRILPYTSICFLA